MGPQPPQSAPVAPKTAEEAVAQCLAVAERLQLQPRTTLELLPQHFENLIVQIAQAADTINKLKAALHAVTG